MHTEYAALGQALVFGVPTKASEIKILVLKSLIPKEWPPRTWKMRLQKIKKLPNNCIIASHKEHQREWLTRGCELGDQKDGKKMINEHCDWSVDSGLVSKWTNIGKFEVDAQTADLFLFYPNWLPNRMPEICGCLQVKIADWVVNWSAVGWRFKALLKP